MGKEKSRRKLRVRGIAETYIHLKCLPSMLSRQEAQAYLEKNARIWAEERFKKPVVVKVRVEEGSLKIWLIVGGISLFSLVSNYGSFRSGIDHIVADAKTFSEFVIEHFNAEENIPPEAVIRVERRLGIPGKIQRYLKKLDKLSTQNISSNERTILVEKLREELLQIVVLLGNYEDRQLVIENSPEEISSNIPLQLPEFTSGMIALEPSRNRYINYLQLSDSFESED